MSEPLVAVVHGVNLDQLGVRDPAHYGTLTLAELEARIAADADELGLRTTFFHTNHEGDLVEHLHSLRGSADAILFNPGAWAHYARALGDALEIAALPTVEVHLSDLQAREPWRQVSVIEELCFAKIGGRGADSYRDALEAISDHLKGAKP